MADLKTQLADLFELQQLDKGIAQRKRALREMDDGTRAAAKRDEEQVRLDEMQGRLDKLRADLRDRELRLKGAEDERKSRSKQAYGGTVHDPKQLSALEKKIAELDRTRGRLEEEMLGLMEQIESLEAEVAQQGKAVAEHAARATALEDRARTETKRIKHEGHELVTRREELAKGIDAPLLAQYDNIRQKSDGIGIAAVKQGSCSGCHVSVPSTYAPRLRARDQVVKCENCRRIIFLPDGESPFTPGEDN